MISANININKGIKGIKAISEANKNKMLNVLNKMQYRCFGYSAVQVCLWTKRAIRGEGVCYKQKFYNITCMNCMQFSPFIFCQENCIHCWRPQELMMKNIKKIKALVYEAEQSIQAKPEEILEKLTEYRKKLLIGFFGNKKLKRKNVEKALKAEHYAISLIGDPLLYKKLPELVDFLHKKNAKSIFVVTNCQEPEALTKLLKVTNNNLHLQKIMQLYLSITATNKKDYLKLKRPLYKDAWERFVKFLKIVKKLKCRKALRYTLIKNVNDDTKNVKELSILANMINSDFIEVKAYMPIGYSLLRLKKENMPTFGEVKKFGNLLENELNGIFNYINDDEKSRVVLLRNMQSKHPNFIS